MKFSYEERTDNEQTTCVTQVVCLQSLSDGTEAERIYTIAATGRRAEDARQSVFTTLLELGRSGHVEGVGRLA